jgi:hypothetical protein
MTTKKQKRIYRGVPLKQFKRFVSIVGTDGDYAAACAGEEGRDERGVMRVVQPYIKRYLRAYRVDCRQTASEA